MDRNRVRDGDGTKVRYTNNDVNSHIITIATFILLEIWERRNEADREEHNHLPHLNKDAEKCWNCN